MSKVDVLKHTIVFSRFNTSIYRTPMQDETHKIYLLFGNMIVFMTLVWLILTIK